MELKSLKIILDFLDGDWAGTMKVYVDTVGAIQLANKAKKQKKQRSLKLGNVRDEHSSRGGRPCLAHK
jgi:hypothetical protein